MREEAHKPQILIADDEPRILRLLSYNVQRLGYTQLMARDGEECIKELDASEISAILLDIKMPKKDGLEVLAHVQENFPRIPVIIVSAVQDINTAVKAIKMGAYDYLTKPINIERLSTVLRNALAMWELREEVGSLQDELRRSELFADIVGESKQLQDVFNHIDRVLKTDVSTLIIGESGTGKELLARAIHRGSKRRNGPFVVVNCAAITHELAESLLFGHRKGSFTGATEDRMGYFEQADQGTIFLDEIGNMAMNVQAKVLRILEEKFVRRIGEKTERKLDFRVISATNCDLTKAIEENSFRKDLYFRLEEYPIYIPPLRERKEDIPLLIRHFLREFCESNEMELKKFSKQAVFKLLNHTWPGNIRELRNVVTRAAIRSAGAVIEDVAFSDMEEIPLPGENLSTERTEVIGEDVVSLYKIERDAVQRAYRFADRNAAEAAKLLGISRATMYRKLKKIGLEE